MKKADMVSLKFDNLVVPTGANATEMLSKGICHIAGARAVPIQMWTANGKLGTHESPFVCV
jgi:hypothetical protein